jgi:hypothetical protein
VESWYGSPEPEVEVAQYRMPSRVGVGVIRGWVESRGDGLESGRSDMEEGTGTRTGADGSQGTESRVEVGGVAECNGSRSQDRSGVTDLELDQNRGSELEEVRGWDPRWYRSPKNPNWRSGLYGCDIYIQSISYCCSDRIYTSII